MKAGVTINRPPRDGNMAFVRSPDKHSIELLQKGAAAAAEGAVDLDAEYRELVRAFARSGRRDCAESQSSLYVARLSMIPKSGQRFSDKDSTQTLPASALSRPSSSGPGHRPFTAETRVRFP